MHHVFNQQEMSLPSTLKGFLLVIRDLHKHVPYVIPAEAQLVPSKYHVSHGFCQQASDKPAIEYDEIEYAK